MEVVDKIKSELLEIYSKEETESIISLIFNKLAGISSTEFLLSENKELPEKIIQKIESAVERLKLNEPIQYVLGQTEFYGLPFITDRRALIPRPETEELVEWILQSSPNASSILDIGTGSGCIAVTLAHKLKKCRVSAFDISLDALNLAHENADLNFVFVHFYHCNILKMNNFDEKFDVIVSNPPYVLNSQKTEMNPNVLDYEPALALFVPDNNALLFYEHIINFAKKQLSPNGILFFEINHFFGNQIVKLLTINKFKNIELKKDISGKNRMIRAEI
ncbi:MAG: peptide chain release factor N(5)-glutamine methyltransferase [Prevotellaceae bacterium]|jgi:release factor glutamine methyltransferase|nr:peptide chain release factor N(5)-glutamine methyltransferase [Prevotellaceae bacterium]